MQLSLLHLGLRPTPMTSLLILLKFPWESLEPPVFHPSRCWGPVRQLVGYLLHQTTDTFGELIGCDRSGACRFAWSTSSWARSCWGTYRTIHLFRLLRGRANCLQFYLVIGVEDIRVVSCRWFDGVTFPLCFSSCNICSWPGCLVHPGVAERVRGDPFGFLGGSRLRGLRILLLTDRACGLPHDLIAGARVQSIQWTLRFSVHLDLPFARGVWTSTPYN